MAGNKNLDGFSIILDHCVLYKFQSSKECVKERNVMRFLNSVIQPKQKAKSWLQYKYELD